MARWRTTLGTRAERIARGDSAAVHLGEYDETKQSGPVAYLRFQVPAQPLAAAQTPILYLPGIPRTAFRSATDFPEDVRHLFALQFEGQFWLQKNGKDWTPTAILASADGGMGLDVARDADTAAALRECLAKVLEADVAALAGRRLRRPISAVSWQMTRCGCCCVGWANRSYGEPSGKGRSGPAFGPFAARITALTRRRTANWRPQRSSRSKPLAGRWCGSDLPSPRAAFPGWMKSSPASLPGSVRLPGDLSQRESAAGE